MTLLESAVRLLLVVTVLIWLPGWLAGRRPLRTASILHSMLVGTGIFLGLLIAVTSVSQRLEWVTAAMAGGTMVVAVALAVRWARRPAPPGDDHRVTLTGRMAFAVGLCVALAALLRWFHNYHFDDFQHLVYLTEIERQGVLFPRQFMLHVEWGSLGDRALVVSRYPFWAAHHIVLSRLAGVPVGDAYYLLGLGLLAFTLGLITALLRDVVSSSTGAIVGLAALLAGGHLLTNDEVLNFGAYPFQSGKLFVLVAAIACLAYWRSRLPVYLPHVAVGLFVAPLLHTNNILGAGVVFVVAACAAAVLRSKALVVAGSTGMAAVLIAGVIALTSAGFMRLVVPETESADVPRPSRARSIDVLPDNPAMLAPAPTRERLAATSRATPVPAGRFEGYNIVGYDGWYYAIPDGAIAGPLEGAELAGIAGSLRGRSRAAVELRISQHLNRSRGIDELAVGRPGNVRGRLTLFLKRSMPLELLLVLAVIGVHRHSGASILRILTAALLGAFVLIILVKSGGALARQVATTTFKPGYLAMRQSLQAASELIGPQGILTDPITYVYGSAAGWALPDPPPFSLEEQFGRLLIFHPDIRGASLEYLLAAEHTTLLIVNEAVLGPAVAAKFDDIPGVQLLLQTGHRLPAQQALARSSETVVEHLYSLDYAAARDEPAAHARTLWRLLFHRPLYVFSRAAVEAGGGQGRAFTGTLHTAPAGSGDSSQYVPLTQRAHLNTVLLRASLPRECFSHVSFTLEGTATFRSPVLIHVLPTGRAARHWTTSAMVNPKEVTTVPVPFLRPVCGPGDVTFFIHGDRLYDFRFQVQSVDWRRHPVTESPGAR